MPPKTTLPLPAGFAPHQNYINWREANLDGNSIFSAF